MIEAIGSFLAVTVGCCALLALLSPRAKKKAGVWLIARGEAQEEARMFFIARRNTLTCAFIRERPRSQGK